MTFIDCETCIILGVLPLKCIIFGVLDKKKAPFTGVFHFGREFRVEGERDGFVEAAQNTRQGTQGDGSDVCLQKSTLRRALFLAEKGKGIRTRAVSLSR